MKRRAAVIPLVRNVVGEGHRGEDEEVEEFEGTYFVSRIDGFLLQ